MFVRGSAKECKTMLEGIQRQTLANGEKSLLCKFILEKDADLPWHSHPHEQIGYLISGAIKFMAEGQEDFIATLGDSWVFPGEVKHAAKVLERTELVEVFVPARVDYID